MRLVEVDSSLVPTTLDRSFVLVATYLPVKSFWSIVPFFRLIGGIESQLHSSPGLARYGLRADLLRKRFWTISVWSNREDMASFSRSEPHRTAMKKFYEWGTEKAAIVEYSNSDGRVDWSVAETMLGKPTIHYRYDERNRLVRG